MEWAEVLQRSLRYMEEHLLEDITLEEVASSVYLSCFYFHRGFKLMTGYTVTEYIRSRRLYLAALEAISGRYKIIDLAYRYGYDTPESFTKAFTRFHGVSPLQIRNHTEKIKLFLPLKIKIQVLGGNEMDYVVERLTGFQLIGFEREFSYDSAYGEIPKFWNEVMEKYVAPIYAKGKPEGAVQQAIHNYSVGEYGVSIDDLDKEGEFRYLIAGKYSGGEVAEGMTLYTLPEMEWAKFRCTGPMPGALQSVNTKIFSEWLPGNPDYEIAMGVSVEWYSSSMDTHAQDYESGIWIPVKHK